MAMPPGNDPSAAVAGNWIPDERDGFISWLRAEFAAANAIIDSLCQHIQAIGDQNEYDEVFSSIQQRRINWSQVLSMQQFFPVAKVSYNLQQIAWNRQQKTPHQPPQRHYNSGPIGRYGGRRSGPGFNKYHGGGGYRGVESMARNGHHSNSDYYKVSIDENRDEAKLASDVKALSVAEEKRDSIEKLKKSDSKDGTKPGDLEESESGSETQMEIANHNYNSRSSEQKQDEEDKECTASIAKTFVVQEMYEAKLVNVVEGLKLYDKILDGNEVAQLVSLVNNLKIAGRRGQLQREAYVNYKRPNRGHGREMIQLGLPIADMSPDDERIKGRRIEPIPSYLSDIIERLVSEQIIPVKPDTCIIDFYSEGDHSHPHMLVPWFGRPVGILFLSECDFTFGRVIVYEYPSDYKGSLKLSLTPGSVLMVEGKSADLAKFAIHSTRKQRILITFTKSQPRNSITGSNWGPPSSRSPNHHIRHQTTDGVLPTPSHRPPNGAAKPVFIAHPTAWSVPPHQRHQQPPQARMPISGTGVYLPPGTTQEPVYQGSPEKPDNSNGSNSTEEEKLDLKTKQEAEE